jgi:hypothetical protein
MLRRVIVPAVTLFLVGAVVFVYVGWPRDPQIDLNSVVNNNVPPQYAIASLDVSQYRHSEAVQRSVNFILSLQPTGTYILTSPGQDDVVHMDVAHSVIALSKVERVGEAKAAMNWLLSQMTQPGDEDAKVTLPVDGHMRTVSYAGSWWDHLHSSGVPDRNQTRGRGEGVGMVLIAINAIYQEDPSYLSSDVDGEKVIDYVIQSASYLRSAAIQEPNGRFVHRPDYRVSFNEECARMALGLELAAKMVADHGNEAMAANIKAGADKGLAALQTGDDMNKGMAFDFYAKSIWGLDTAEAARTELASLRQAKLVTGAGVRNWDWQQSIATSLFDKVKYWAIGLTTAPAQTFDWGIANVVAGDLLEALKVEKNWLPLQRSDGGFGGTYALGLRLPIGAPNSYTAARFILFERMLTEAMSHTEA